MQKRNESFICIGCGATVQPAPKTCRNHCPTCFLSLHVDGAIPGDRATTCGGKMIPIEFLQANGGIKIHFVCIQCKKSHRNKVAHDDLLVTLPERIKERKHRYYLSIDNNL